MPTATVVVTTPAGTEQTYTGTGNGSVEAIFNTLEQIAEGKVNVLDYRVTSVGKGEDALGEAVINVEYNGFKYTGRDAAQDVLEASAKAYVNAVNRHLLQASTRQGAVN